MAVGAKVVKAFNHVYAPIIHSSPQFGSQNATVFYCGDHADAKATVARLVTEIGFDPVDAGPLKNARYIEPLAELCIQLAYGLRMGTDIAIKLIPTLTAVQDCWIRDGPQRGGSVIQT